MQKESWKVVRWWHLFLALSSPLLLPSTLARAKLEQGEVRPPARQPHRVLVVRRPGCADYETVIEEFRSRVRAVVRLLPMSLEKSGLQLWFRTYQPDLIFTVGQAAYDQTRAAGGHPLLHAFAFHRLDPRDPGLRSRVPPEDVWRAFRLVQPTIRHVAVLHGLVSPADAETTRRAAEALGLVLHELRAPSPAEAISLLRRMSTEVEGIWLPADLTVLSPQVVQYVLGIQFRRHVLLMGATRRHVVQGALFAMSYDAHDVGQRAAELANTLLARRPARQEVAPGPPRLYLSRTTARTLGLAAESMRMLEGESVD